MESTIVYCPDCGEYLGDLIDGVLWKFGHVVAETHVCTIEGRLMKDRERKGDMRQCQYGL